MVVEERPVVESYASKEYKIKNIKQYTENVKLFQVECSMCPKPGQFFEVMVPGVGEGPFASCSCEDKMVEILMRSVGKVTTEIFKKRVGDSMWIRGPYGKGFSIEELKGKNIIMVAGGTGIAPITSMIHYIEQNRSDFGKVYIYFGFRDEEHVLLEKRIDRWKKEFHLNVGLSRDPDAHKYEKGYINEIMERHKPPVDHTVALLCGPEGMMKSVTDELNHLGIINSKVYWSMERRMECAFGSCGRCQLQDLYVCKDGPVFRYDVVKPRLDNENWSNENE
jgi:anaerobic sulfite reductase subunit B